jgi:hypothetical protein
LHEDRAQSGADHQMKKWVPGAARHRAVPHIRFTAGLYHVTLTMPAWVSTLGFNHSTEHMHHRLKT